MYLDLPGALLGQTMDAEAGARSLVEVVDPAPRQIPTPEAVARALDVLRGAKKPLVILGKGAAYAQADDAIRAFVEKSAIPYLPMSMAKGLLPDTHPQSAGPARSLVLKESDVVVLVGARLNWLLSHGKGKTWGDAPKRFVQVDIEPREIDSNLGIAAPVVGDSGNLNPQSVVAGEEKGVASQARGLEVPTGTATRHPRRRGARGPPRTGRRGIARRDERGRARRRDRVGWGRHVSRDSDSSGAIMTERAFSDLEPNLRGELIARADEAAFEAARFRGFNRDLNMRAKPLAFVIASGVRDIVTTVNYCRSNEIPIAVRGKGSHSPYGMANDAVVIDLMKMTAVRVDPESKLAYIQAGADGGDVDHETALHDLVCLTGSVSHTGFAGVALGGGIGHLSRWLGAVVDSIVGYQLVTTSGEVVRVDASTDPELFWGMRGNGASFGIVTEFTLALRDMPNNGIIRSAPILWGLDKAKDVMTSWMKRILRPDRKDTETLQFAFLHSPDGQPVCGIVPLIVGESEAAGQATCDELAAYGGGALVRQDTQLPYTALQAALDPCFPFNANYWDKGVFINWDPNDEDAAKRITDISIQHWNEKPDFSSKLSTFLLFMEVNGAVGRADPRSTSFSARGGRLWCTAIAGWPRDDASQRAASKKWCDDFVEKLSPFHVTTYVNNAMPTNEAEMLGVFSEDTIRRLRALKEKQDPGNLLRAGAWQFEANL